MKSAYQLLSIIALYSDVANTFYFFGAPQPCVYCWRRVPNGRLYFIAAHGG